MRTNNNRVLKSAFLLALSISAMTSCGKSSGGSGTNVNGQGAINPATGLPYTAAGAGTCIPLGSAIGFTANNIYMDYANVVGGQVPFSSTSAGQITTGGAVTAGGYSSYGTSNVSISMNLINPIANTALPYTGYPNQSLYNQNSYTASYAPYGYNNFNQGSNRVSGSGVIQLSQMVIQDIQYKVANGQIQIPGYTAGNYMNTYAGIQAGINTGIPSYYNNTYPQNGYQNGYQQNAGMPQICISGIALNIGKNNQNRLYGGQIYLYLNGSSHGYVTGIY